MMHSEFRQDPISENWVLIAPGRFQYDREHHFRLQKKQKRIIAPKEKCPFEHPFDNVSEQIILQYPDKQSMKKGKGWELLVLQNKYPVVTHSSSRPKERKTRIVTTMPGVGHHDLIITRDHNANFPKLSEELAFQVFVAFQNRYRTLQLDENIRYISMFHNWGPLSGASVYHPHYQIISIPVLSRVAAVSLQSVTHYAHKYHECPYCMAIRFELQEKKRVIYENKYAIAVAPFVSWSPFEIKIFPKRHLPFFEDTSEDDMRGVTEALQVVLRKLQKRLYDPDYNFFIHTAPVQGKKKFDHYHWHIEIVPKISIRAGFEFGSGIETNVADPDMVAKIIRS